MNNIRKYWLEEKTSALLKRYKAYFGVRPFHVAQADIATWFATPLGMRVFAEEQRYIDTLLADMFGYHLMSMSVLPHAIRVEASPTSHQFLVNPFSVSACHDLVKKEAEKKYSIVRAKFEDLPIASNSIDVALLHHVLDFSSNPHQLLREATRALMPNGHIILVGFNPWSLLGGNRALSCVLSHSHFYRQHHLHVARLKDWFKVLELELVYSDKGYFGLPLNGYSSPKLETIGKKIYPCFGGFYVLVLRKSVTPMRMIKSSWKNKKVLPKWRKGMATSSTTRSTHNE